MTVTQGQSAWEIMWHVVSGHIVVISINGAHNVGCEDEDDDDDKDDDEDDDEDNDCDHHVDDDDVDD